MSTNTEELVKIIRYYQDSLDKYSSNGNNYKLLSVIKKLRKLPIATSHLEDTGIGRTVNALRKLGGEVGDAAKALVTTWKEMVVQEDVKKEDSDRGSTDTSLNNKNDTVSHSYEKENRYSETKHKEREKSSNHKSSDKERGNSEKHNNATSKSSHDKRDKKEKDFNKHMYDHDNIEKSSSRSHSDSNSESEEESYESKNSKSSDKHRSDSDEDEDTSSSDDEKSSERQKTKISSEDTKKHKYDKNSTERHSGKRKHHSSSSSESEEDEYDRKPEKSENKGHRSEKSDKTHQDKQKKDVSKSSSYRSSHHKKDNKEKENSSKKHKHDHGDSKSHSSKRKFSSSGSESEEEEEENQSNSRYRSDFEDEGKRHNSKKSKHTKSNSESEDNKKKHKSKSSKSDRHEREKSKSREKTEKSSSRSDTTSKRDSEKNRSNRGTSDTEEVQEKSKSKHEKESKSHSGKHEKKDKRDKEKEGSRDKHSHKRDESKHDEKERNSKEDKKESRKEKSSSSSSKSKDSGMNSKHKSSSEKSKKPETVNVKKIAHGIDSESGASFAEALGMCGPMAFSKPTSSSKKKSSSTSLPIPEKQNKNAYVPSSSKTERAEAPVEKYVPSLLKEQPAEPLHINISSLLPEITPHYKPIAFPLDSQPKRLLTPDEALSQAISNKNLRTKVYSGNKTKGGEVESLFNICVKILQDNLDAIECTGGVPYHILKPILEKATPDQLFNLEHYNPYLIEETDELWQLHCSKEFRTKKREEMETWREMYMRCLDEREAKLNAITANIKESQDKSLPVRTTKLAYIDSIAKPPRNVARRQAKNGIVNTSPVKTMSSKLATLATAGEAGKVSVPNPGRRATDRASTSSSSHSAVKPKKAPLMAKTLTLFKNRFKR